MSYFRSGFRRSPLGQLDVKPTSGMFTSVPLQQTTEPTAPSSGGITPMTSVPVNPMISSGDVAFMQTMQAIVDPAAFDQPLVSPPPEGVTAMTANLDPAAQPSQGIVIQGAPVTEPMPTHPVTGTAPLTAPITAGDQQPDYLPPAQPPVQVSKPDPCPPGMKLIPGMDCVPEKDIPVGPIPEGTPPVGPIPGSSSTDPSGYYDMTTGQTTGPIPEGTPPVGPIPEGTPEGTNYQYTNGYVQQQTTTPTEEKSYLVPILLAVGGVLLLSKLLK